MEPIANVFELREDYESFVDECLSCPVHRDGDLSIVKDGFRNSLEGHL